MLGRKQIREGLTRCTESGLHQDYEEWLERLAHEPVAAYKHNLTGEDNADAHLKRAGSGSYLKALPM